MNDDNDSVNVHQRYVNAERGDEGIPEYFKQKLTSNPQNNLLQQAVFRELWYSDDVIHSLRSLESDFDETKQTIKSRLDEMVEQGILKKGSMNNGDYWWINFPDSEHPLPKDIVVYPKPGQEKMTVDEFFTQLHVIIGVVSLLVTAVGGAMVLLGALQMGDSLSLPIATEDILTGGLWALYLSYIALFIAVVAWVVDKASASDEGGKILEKG